MNIILFSSDNFLIKYLKKEFSNVHVGCNEVNYSDIVIIDDNVDLSKKYINNFTINISNNVLDNIVNIALPFKLDDLKNKINNLQEYITKNVYIFNNYIIDISKNIILINNKEFQLTAKEIELILFLFKNPDSNKIDILDKVWNNKNIDNKSIETTIYNIRQKTNKDSFIVCNNGNYSIGDYNEN